jgi:TPR repeat protein
VRNQVTTTPVKSEATRRNAARSTRPKTPTTKTKDNADAERWYRRAAERGFAEAQNNLGLMYVLGRGVPQDDAEAVKWFRRAAEQGYAPAQNNLGQMRRQGRGVTK